MIKVDIRPPTDRDVAFIGTHARAADCAEAAAYAACTVTVGLRRSVGLSHETWCGLVNDEPVCVFGLGVGSALAGTARPWLIGTDRLDLYAVPFLRRNRSMVRRWSRDWPVLENWVDVRNVRSVAWLRWLGFTIEAPAPFGPYKYPFHRFEMVRTKEVALCA